MKEHIAVIHIACQKLYCSVCDGGLFMCAVCGCAEGATTTHCPGIQVPGATLDAIYAGRINFRDGMWRHENVWELK